MHYRQTPPIQYLPVFESAARHLSFKRAADELCVTAPAVGQQVKAFEAWLGKPLFHRHTRRLSLTREGEYYFALASDILNRHQQGYIQFKRQFDDKVFHLSASLFVAQEVIMPNYLRFSQYVPNTELRLDARVSYVDFALHQMNAAVRFGEGNWPDLEARLLAKGSVSPVCSETYLSQHADMSPDTLYQNRLLYSLPDMDTWGPYFWGSDRLPEQEPVLCDSYLAAIKLACEGVGVALGIFPTINKWMAKNGLVQPFDIRVNLNRSFWFVYPKGSNDPRLDQAYQWLKCLFEEMER